MKINDVVMVTNDSDGYGYPEYIGEIGYVTDISSDTVDGGTIEDPVIFVEFNKRILAELDGDVVDKKMQLFKDELEVVGHVGNCELCQPAMFEMPPIFEEG